MTTSVLPSARQAEKAEANRSIGMNGRRSLGYDLLNQKLKDHETVNILAKNVQDLERKNKVYNSYSMLNKSTPNSGGSLFMK